MSLEQTMKWANEKINEQAVENGKLQQRIAELEAKIDVVVECNGVIRYALMGEKGKLMYTEDSIDKALAAIEALQQPDSGEQEK
jgi:hypothetical protein